MSLKSKRIVKGLVIEKNNTERSTTLTIEHDAANTNSMVLKVPNLAAPVTMELPEEGTKLLSETSPATLENKTIDASLNTIINLEVDASNVDSGLATAGRVLTADGVGGASWENAGSGANVTLSNLLSPTSVNQDLLPDTDNTRDLGSASNTWANITSQQTNTNALYTVSGTGSISLGNDINANLNSIENLADPVSAGDAANKDYVDTTIATEIAALDIASKIDADGSVAFTADQSMGNNKLTNLASPSTGSDATNKTYVDGYVASQITANKPAYYLSSTSTGNYPTNSSSFVDVPNLTVNATTSGRPVVITVVPDGTTSEAFIQAGGTGTNIIINFQILRDATVIATHRLGYFQAAGGSNSISVPVSSIFAYDTPSAGTYVYKVQIRAATASTTAQITYAKLLVREL